MATRKARAGAKKAEPGKKASAGKRASKTKTESSTRTENSQASADKNSDLGLEAFAAMGTQASRIVGHLLEQAIKGDMKSAQILVNLASKENAAKEALQQEPLRSQVLAWAAEPPWEDEVDPEKAEAESGPREPE